MEDITEPERLLLEKIMREDAQKIISRFGPERMFCLALTMGINYITGAICVGFDSNEKKQEAVTLIMQSIMESIPGVDQELKKVKFMAEILKNMEKQND